MSDALLKKKIRSFFREQLEPRGFVLKHLRMPQRHLKDLRHALEFQPGDRNLSGQFTVNVCWTFTFPTPDEHGFQGRRRIGEIAGRVEETWFSCEPDKLDQDFACVAKRILDFSLPYLDRHNSVEAILSSYERGGITADQAFGPDVGWQLFHLGFCYARLGRPANAIPPLRRLIENHSSHPYEWVKARKAQAEEKLARLEQAFPQIAADVRHIKVNLTPSTSLRARLRDWVTKRSKQG